MSDRQTTAVSEPKTRTGAAYFFARLWKEKPLGTASGIIIVLFVLTAIFADVLAPHGMLEMSLGANAESGSKTIDLREKKVYLPK